MIRARTALLMCLAVGVALEVGISLATGRREAWDASLYWTVGLPAAIVTSAVVGYFSDGRGWLSAIGIVPAQVAAMMFRSHEIGNLWPLTIALSSLLSLPFLFVSFLARRRRTARQSG